MTDVLLVSEGPNDRAVIPVIIEKATNQKFEFSYMPWTELRRHRITGFEAKLGLALAVARLNSHLGLVGVVDADDQPKVRIAALRRAKEKDRQKLDLERLPTALGEANPELEAWLLDDHEAVKKALALPAQTKIPSPFECKDVKISLDELISKSARNENRTERLCEIAKSIEFDKCRNSKATGLQSFVDDLKNEFV